MTVALTDADKLRRIHWNTALSAINTVFAQMIYFGAVFPLFLAELNFTNTQIGFLFSLIPFAALVAIVAAPAAARFGYKRTFVTFFGIRKVVTTFLLLTPWVLAQWGPQAVLIYVSVVMVAFSIVRAIAEMAIYPWAREFIPNSIRGKYTAVNDIISRLTAVAAIALAGYLLTLPMGLNRYMLIFGIALGFGWAAVWAASHIPGGAPIKGSAGAQTSYRHILSTLLDQNFRFYLIAFGLAVLGMGPMGSFLPLYLEREIGLSESQVVLLQNGGLVGGLLSVYLLGWAADRYGSRPVMLAGLVIKVILPVFWLVMPRFSDWSMLAALAISFVNGIADIAWAIGSVRLLYVGVVPPEKTHGYMAVYYAISGLVGGISLVAGGRIVDAAAGLSGQFLIFPLDQFSPLFIGGIVLTAASIFLFRRVKADSDFGLRDFASMFIHGNPLQALEFMVRYYRARDERTTVVMTERMGQTRSPLTVDELLEALIDPRFNVRFEAVISIARMDSDPRLVEALCKLLDGTELSLSTIAAWALGRIGDESALPALRNGLDSDYRSIRAHCARALGTLHDTSVIPLLLERLQTETDKGLRIAYAVALGQMGSVQVTDTLFKILDTTENEGARLELALSIARLTGYEQPFVRLLRQSRHDKGTSISQTVFGLRKQFPHSESIDRLARDAASAFARNDFVTGMPLLSQLIGYVPKTRYSEAATRILDACEKALRDTGTTHVEYVILALHIMETANL